MSTSSQYNIYHYENFNAQPNQGSNSNNPTSSNSPIGNSEGIIVNPQHSNLQHRNKNYIFYENYPSITPTYHGSLQEFYNGEVPLNSAAHPTSTNNAIDPVNQVLQYEPLQNQYHAPHQYSISSSISNSSQNFVPASNNTIALLNSPNKGTAGIMGGVSATQPKEKVTHIKPRIFTTFWEDENTVCYQVEAHGILVSRREDSNYINGTKLLNVAGMTRGKRDGILKTERAKKVIKIGSMNLKGVWIPFERASEIARNEGIDSLLYPLFVKDLKTFFKKNGAKLTNDNYIKSMQTNNDAENNPNREDLIPKDPKTGSDSRDIGENLSGDSFSSKTTS